MMSGCHQTAARSSHEQTSQTPRRPWLAVVRPSTDFSIWPSVKFCSHPFPAGMTLWGQFTQMAARRSPSVWSTKTDSPRLALPWMSP